MSRKCSLSIVLFIYIVFFSVGKFSASEEHGKIIIISEHVGKEIEQEEREQSKLSEGIKGFQSAVYKKPPYGKYILKITYIDETTNELKIDRTQQSEASIRMRGYYVDHFEEIKARKYQNIISDTSKSSDIKEKDFYITPYLGLSTLVGTIGIEFQYKHFGFDIGDLISQVVNVNHCLTGGIRYYFNSNHNSWFIGLGGGITLDEPKQNEDLCPWSGSKPADYVCKTGYVIDKYMGIIFGYRWKWWKALNLNLGIGPNKLKWKKIKEGDKGDYLPMLELVIGYSF